MIAEALTSIKRILSVGSVIASEAKQSILPFLGTMDCVVAEPVIGRAFARPVGSSQ
jgi:hypothetical protein